VDEAIVRIYETADLKQVGLVAIDKSPKANPTVRRRVLVDDWDSCRFKFGVLRFDGF
jgi:hypothetical protein